MMLTQGTPWARVMRETVKGDTERIPYPESKFGLI